MSFGNGNVKTAIDLTSGGASPRRAAPVSSPSFASGQQSAIRVTFTRRREKEGGERGGERGGEGGIRQFWRGKRRNLKKKMATTMVVRSVGGSVGPRVHCRPTPNLTYSSLSETLRLQLGYPSTIIPCV